MSPIKIFYLDEIPEKILKAIKRGLKTVYGEQNHEIGIEEKIKFPSSSFDPSRKQYDANRILEHVSTETGNGSITVLAITRRDIFSDDLNFVFGIANPKLGTAIISTNRLGETGERKEAKEIILKRIQKEAVHEVGHLKGLKHCPDPKCVMSFSKTLLDVDRKEKLLCDKCKDKLLR